MNCGEVQKVKFGLFKNTFLFECMDHGVVLERDGKAVCIYATDAAHSNIYCALPLGPEKAFKNQAFFVAAPDSRYMLLGVKNVLVVVDFVNKTCATNVPQLRIFGSDAWGQECQSQWKGEYDQLFGLAMDEAAADAFWAWFAENEEKIVASLSNLSAGGQGASQIIDLIDGKLAPVFPYVPAGKLEFELGCNESLGEFRFFHCGDPRLERDGQLLKERMPETLQANWQLMIER